MAPRHIRVLQVLQNMGFLGILQCGHIEIDTHLITALVERWRPETHTFHFSVGEATITLQDIAVIWALPIEGNLITGVVISYISDAYGPQCHTYYPEYIGSYAGKRDRSAGHHGEDWTAFHRHYVLKWNDVHSLSVVRPEVSNGRATVPDYMNWYHQISRVQISHRIVSTNTIGYCPTDPRDWEAVYNLMENMTLHAENFDPNDNEQLRDVRSRTIAYGRQMMNFSGERYPSVRVGPTGTYEAGPSNVYTEPGPLNVYTPAGPSNVYTPYGPSNVYMPAGPQMSILKRSIKCFYSGAGT
ncbi:UNVERIFIED_CONTAM: Serine/threonine-protein phosphatase 7 long form [Sesamum latifolium]|uniref:Serine/threonine-protein phosphatase 7 long form n=1 Tax=Sesamum latifolium TaxID=2727402 RepID=A0AAW2Y7U7_9LAMI